MLSGCSASWSPARTSGEIKQVFLNRYGNNGRTYAFDHARVRMRSHGHRQHADDDRRSRGSGLAERWCAVESEAVAATLWLAERLMPHEPMAELQTLQVPS